MLSYYSKVLKLQVKSLLPGSWILQQYNEAVHTLKYTKPFLEASEFGVLDWLSKPLGLNIIKILIGMLLSVVHTE